jgi:chaperonin GroES
MKPFRLLEDNVLIRLEPLEGQSGAIHVVRSGEWDNQRLARVLMCGPGHYTEPYFGAPRGAFVPVEPKPGDLVLVSKHSGHTYRRGLDIHTPRQNANAEFGEMFDERGEYRVIRAEEAYARRTVDGLEALGRHVIVKRDDFEEKTPGGIIIPLTVDDKNSNGTVVSVGRGRTLRDGTFRQHELEVGDRVLFGQHAGNPITVPGLEGLMVLRDEDVIATYGAAEAAE